MDIAQYLQKAKVLSDELATAGKSLSSSEFNAIIYRNIGMEFYPVVSALNLRSEPISFTELYSQLISHKILIKSYATQPSAHFTTRPPVSSPRPYFPNTNPSFYRHNPKKRKCQICGYSNHTADRCRRHYNSRTTHRPQANFTWKSPCHSAASLNYYN